MFELCINDIPSDCIDECAASGDCSDAVEFWCDLLSFEVNRADVIPGLLEYGAWDTEELAAKSDDEIWD